MPYVNTDKLNKYEDVPKNKGAVTMPTDDVNHPEHYTGKYECLDVMIETQGIDAVLDFCICNAFKYIYRHRKKNGIEDIRKAQWYINKYIEIVEKDLKEREDV